MTLLEKASKIRDLRFEVMEARVQLTMCSIDYSKWLNCYNRCLNMINSKDLEVVAIGQGLAKSLMDASVFFNENNSEELDAYTKTLDFSSRVKVSNR